MAIENSSSEADGDNINGSGHVNTSRSISSFDSFNPFFLQNSDIPGVNLAHFAQSSHSRPHYEEGESSALAAAAVSRYGSDSKQKQRSIVTSRYEEGESSNSAGTNDINSRDNNNMRNGAPQFHEQGFTADQFQKLLTLIDKQESPENVDNMADSNPPIVTSQSPVPLLSPPSTSSPSLPQPPVSQTPTAHMKFTTSDYDKHLRKHDDNESDDPQLIDKHVYQRLVGKLLYVSLTRPDISYAVQTLSQFMHDPKQSHLEGALHFVRYLKGRPSLGILLSSKKDCTLRGFCDSDWASCAVTRKSVTGYCMKLGSSLISWKPKKQETISRSTAEAEYRSMASAVAEIIWLVGLLEEMNMKVKIPPLLSDSPIRVITCKAGNRICSSLTTANSFLSRSCDIYCSDPSFCRDCCCILCCKTISSDYDVNNYIRCESIVDGYICGHVSHLDCVLRAYMAGTVGGSINLDAQYLCRYCYSRMDLVPHVLKLLNI
uniref:Oberon-like PHD finger domain-containing protein n=1 Tax=Solanum lycopersicum TaxID=4081 RepID=A0A3Q7I459_SOLLC